MGHLAGDLVFHTLKGVMTSLRADVGLEAVTPKIGITQMLEGVCNAHPSPVHSTPRGLHANCGVPGVFAIFWGVSPGHPEG